MYDLVMQEECRRWLKAKAETPEEILMVKYLCKCMDLAENTEKLLRRLEKKQ